MLLIRGSSFKIYKDPKFWALQFHKLHNIQAVMDLVITKLIACRSLLNIRQRCFSNSKFKIWKILIPVIWVNNSLLCKAQVRQIFRCPIFKKVENRYHRSTKLLISKVSKLHKNKRFKIPIWDLNLINQVQFHPATKFKIANNKKLWFCKLQQSSSYNDRITNHRTNLIS